MIIDSFFHRISLFECSIKFGKTIGQKCLTVRNSVFGFDAQLL